MHEIHQDYLDNGTISKIEKEIKEIRNFGIFFDWRIFIGQGILLYIEIREDKKIREQVIKILDKYDNTKHDVLIKGKNHVETIKYKELDYKKDYGFIVSSNLW